MRRFVVVVAALSAVLVLAGCTVGTTIAGRSVHAASSASGTAAPTPTRSPTRDQLTAWVDAAAPSATVLGSPTVEEHKGIYGIPVPCPNRYDGVTNVVWSHVWYWTGGKLGYLEEQAVAVWNPEAKYVVAMVAVLPHNCQTYPYSDNGGTYTITELGDDKLAAPAGIDGAFAWCEQSTQLTPAKNKGDQAVYCDAVLSRGQALIRLRAYGDDPTVASAEQKLGAAIPLTVPAFIAADPLG